MTNPADDTESATSPNDDGGDVPEARHVNSVDATVGQPLVARVMDRKAELEALLTGLDKHDTHTRDDIEAALARLPEMLSGDLTAVPAVVMVDLNHWIERTKHLGERATPMTPVDADAPANSADADSSTSS